MSAVERPLPKIDDSNRPFWSGAREGRLVLQKCAACSHIRYPIARFCPRCLSEEAKWTRMSGCGQIFSYVVFHRAYHKAFEHAVPYNVALVRLDEGPMMFSNINRSPDELCCDDGVEVEFTSLTDDVSLPVFRSTGINWRSTRED